MSTLTDLIAARSLISLPRHWTPGVLALNADGDAESVNSNRAVSFCAIGAILRNTNDIWPCIEALKAAIPADFKFDSFRGHPVPLYNNASNHETVLAWFDRAIERQRLIEDMQDWQDWPAENVESSAELENV